MASLNILNKKIESFKDLVAKQKPTFIDVEGLHFEEDEIMRYFVKVTASNKYNREELSDIAKKIKEINKYMDNEVGRWYA